LAQTAITGDIGNHNGGEPPLHFLPFSLDEASAAF
jgi:hypothetical protein